MRHPLHSGRQNPGEGHVSYTALARVLSDLGATYSASFATA